MSISYAQHIKSIESEYWQAFGTQRASDSVLDRAASSLQFTFMGSASATLKFCQWAGGAYRRVERVLLRIQDTAHHFFSNFFVHCLSPHEQSQLSLNMYSKNPSAYAAHHDLYDWERRWYSVRLPKGEGKSHVFVGGAGGGREVTALRHMGYRCDAAEPCEAFAPMCREAIGSTGQFFNMGYEEMIDALGYEHHAKGDVFSDKRYDAILLGWSSFSHVLDADSQFKLLQLFHRLCPDGPILLSYWPFDGTRNAPTNRAARCGTFLAKWVAKHLRGWDADALDVDPQVRFHSWCGFMRTVRTDELEAWAARLGRQIIYEKENSFPHVTLIHGEMHA